MNKLPSLCSAVGSVAGWKNVQPSMINDHTSSENLLEKENFTQASADMVDFHVAVLTQALHSEDNYLRIQEDTLMEPDCSVDIATEQNLNRLGQIGESLLKKPVSRVNLETGFSEPIKNGGSNEDALRENLHECLFKKEGFGR